MAKTVKKTEPTETNDEPKAIETPQVATAPPTESPALAEFASHLAVSSRLAPGIASKRAIPSIFAALSELTNSLRIDAIQAANGGRVDVDAACIAAGKSLSGINNHKVPQPFNLLCNVDTVRATVIPVLRISLETWNLQDSIPAAKPSEEPQPADQSETV
jgi:hypothetical protein